MLFSYSAFRLQDCSIKSVSHSCSERLNYFLSLRKNVFLTFYFWFERLKHNKYSCIADEALTDDCPRGRKMCHGDIRKKCIPEYKFCDGVPDCKHGTDEDPNICGQFLPHDATVC